MSPLGILVALPAPRHACKKDAAFWDVLEFIDGYTHGTLLGVFTEEAEANAYIDRLATSFGVVATDVQ